MPSRPQSPDCDVFLSHASEDDERATRICDELITHKMSVWVDHRDLRRKGLLLDALQTVIERSRHVVLLWTEHSVGKRYVAAEWNFAWNRERSIIPCRFDGTQLPLGLAGYLYCDFRASFAEGARQLREALQEQVASPQPLPEVPKSTTYVELATAQSAVLDALGRGDVADAATLQRQLDAKIIAAERQFPDDADILAVAGYHVKNAYLIKHWTAIQAGESPFDPLLGESEQRFWEALRVRPNDASGLNGLGSILSLRGDLDAAEFYVARSIERARQEGFSYPYAEEDLRNIRAAKSARTRR